MSSNNVDNNGNGVTYDNVDDGNGNHMMDDDRTMDDDVNKNGYILTDDNINDNCNGTTNGCHCLDACDGCTMKGEARRRHVTTGNATTSQQTRCKREEKRQRTRGDRALIG